MAQPQHYWFNRRNLGQLLVPVTWQAFVLIGIQAMLVGAAALVILGDSSTWSTIGWVALLAFGLLLTFVVAIAKSPMPRWLRTQYFD